VKEKGGGIFLCIEEVEKTTPHTAKIRKKQEAGCVQEVGALDYREDGRSGYREEDNLNTCLRERAARRRLGKGSGLGRTKDLNLRYRCKRGVNPLKNEYS